MNKPVDRLSFLSGASTAFVEQLYARFLADPEAVDASWQAFFASLGDDVATVTAQQRGASWAPPGGPFLGVSHAAEQPRRKNGAAAAPDQTAVRAATLDSLRALMQIGRASCRKECRL